MGSREFMFQVPVHLSLCRKKNPTGWRFSTRMRIERHWSKGCFEYDAIIKYVIHWSVGYFAGVAIKKAGLNLRRHTLLNKLAWTHIQVATVTSSFPPIQQLWDLVTTQKIKWFKWASIECPSRKSNPSALFCVVSISMAHPPLVEVSAEFPVGFFRLKFWDFKVFIMNFKFTKFL